MIRYVDTPIRYSRERIFRRLRIEPGSYVEECANEFFPSLGRIVEEKLALVQAYALPAEPLGVGIPEVDGSAFQVVCLTSCSDAVMEEVSALLKRGDYLEGYILNDTMNDALFSASNEMNRQIADEMARRGCRLTRRYSPGEGELPLPYQARLLSCFQGEDRLSHIRLTESFMLTPEKSMAYIFGADPRNPPRSVEHDCGQCPNTDCFYRTKKSEVCFFRQ